MALLTYTTVCLLTGKALVGAQTKDEQMAMADHITELEHILDKLDSDDTFGTEGWRHQFGIDEDN